MSWLDGLLGGVTIQVAGVSLPAYPVINLVSGATAVENAAAGRIDVTLSGLPVGSAYQHLEHNGTKWTAQSDITLPGGHRTIRVGGNVGGDLALIAGNNSFGAGGDIVLIPGAGTTKSSEVQLCDGTKTPVIRVGSVEGTWGINVTPTATSTIEYEYAGDSTVTDAGAVLYALLHALHDKGIIIVSERPPSSHG